MIHAIRKFFQSKVGIVVTLGFLVLIALAFASSDVANTGTFGGVSGGDRVAVVGDERVDAADLSTAMTNALDQAREADPTLTMQAFIARGGLTEVVDQLLQRMSLAEFAREHGLRAGDRLIDSELVQIGSFRGADGNFDETAFRAALAQRNLTEAAVRDDLAMGLLARQLLVPITYSAVVPDTFGRRYAALLRETRTGAVAQVPSSSFAPTRAPTSAELQKFYRDNANAYIRPERRVIRYATFGPEVLGTLAAPTAAQIRQRYERDRAQFAPTERRRFTQLVVPTEAAARAVIAEVQGGQALEAAARAKGLATAEIGPVTRAQFVSSSSAPVAQAGFAAAEGALAAPQRGGLGWYVLRVDEIDRQPGKTLEQATPEIRTALAEEQRRSAIADLSADLEERFDDGSSLADVARELKVTLANTPPALANGRIYGSATETLPPVLGRVLETAFDMEEEEPQVAEVVPGETFVIFDISDITPSAAAPLAEIRDDVVTAWRRDQGNRAAGAAAKRILDRTRRGMTLAAAVAAEQQTLPAARPLNFNRQQLAAIGRVPPEMALFFSMAERTVKTLEAGNDNGWWVIQLTDIDAPLIAANDPLVLATLRELGPSTGEEYVRQFVTAAQREVGVERNETAIQAVAAQLTGQQAE